MKKLLYFLVIIGIASSCRTVVTKETVTTGKGKHKKTTVVETRKRRI